MRKRGFCYDKDKHTSVKLIEFIEGRRKVLKISRAALAGMLGMTEQNFGYYLNPQKGNAKFTFLQTVKILEALQATDEEKLKLMRME